MDLYRAELPTKSCKIEHINGLSIKLKETYSCLLYCILRSDVTKARPREPLAILVEAKISLLNLL